METRYFTVLGLILLLVVLSLPGVVPMLAEVPAAPDAVYYVATGGSDDTGDGSSSTPWATITHAVNTVPDGSTVLVRPGTYTGRVRLDRIFATGVTVRSEVPYQARLRNDGAVVTCYYGRAITLEGFDVAHDGSGASPLVIQIQDADGTGAVRHITLRDNVIHDSYNNDLLKINNGARDVLVEGNLFYNQAGSDEHIDINSVTGVIVQDNVFFNDFAGSGRTDDDTSSFVVIKDSNQDDDGQLGSQHIIVRRNVMVHWEGNSGQGFVRVGEDGQSYYEARDVLIENNLVIGNNTLQIRSPFQLMGVYSVTVRANTVAGDMPAKEFGARIFTYGDNPTNDQIHLHNNIWSDSTGTMGDTFNRGGDTTNLTFDNNLFWNAGNPFPTSGESLIEVEDDVHRVVGNPLLGDQAGFVLPRWNPGAGQFADGSATIRQVFERLVALYGTPAAGSPAVDAADPAHAPAEDVLANPRPVGLGPDLGAVEFQGYGFTLGVSPPVWAVDPGQTASYVVGVASVGGFTGTVDLAVANPSPSLTLDLAPVTALSLPAQATLLVTDAHAGPLAAGLWYGIPLTGTGEEITETTTARLLVGGVQAHLPLVLRRRED